MYFKALDISAIDIEHLFVNDAPVFVHAHSSYITLKSELYLWLPSLILSKIELENISLIIFSWYSHISCVSQRNESLINSIIILF